ncbi:MAG: ABC transporter permease [Planctomycetota bacterium]
MPLRLFLQILAIETKKAVSYRMDFWLGAVGSLLAGIGVPYFTWQAIYAARGTPLLGGYTFAGMVAYAIACTLIIKVVRGSDLTLGIANDIYDGTLNRYLVYPAGYLRFKFAQQCGVLTPSLLQLALVGGAFLLVLPQPADLAITPTSVAQALLSMAAANVLHFLICYPVQLVAFWADNVWSLIVMLRFISSLLGGGLIPLELFGAEAREWLGYLPFAHLYWTPVSALLGKLTMAEWLASLATTGLWCLACALVGRVLWRRGQLQYSGIGM